MSIKDEITIISTEAETAETTLTAERVVEAAKDAERFPHLNAHLWKVAEADLAAEARLARAHKLIIRLTVTTEDGSNVRAFLHTRTEKGYRPAQAVGSNLNLAALKLQELTADIGRARQRLQAFRSIIRDDIADGIDEALTKANERIEEARQAAESAA